MAKKVETTETTENVFEGFKFLDTANQKVTKASTKADEVKDDELSQAELDAIEAQAKLNSGKAPEKDDNADTEESSKEEEGEKTEKTDNKEESSLGAFAKYMHDRNILHIEDDEIIETEEDLERITSNTIKKGVNSYKESIPEDGQKFLEFIEAGGKPADFHKYYYGDNSFEGFKPESEDDQKYVITEALKLEGYTEEEITEELSLYEDAGKLESKSNTLLKKLQKVEKEQKDLLLASQKEYAKKQEEDRKESWKKFEDGLFKADAIGGFKFTPKVKTDLWEYMTKVADKKTGKTAYQVDEESNGDSRYIYAYLMKNKFDLKSLERMVETKKVSELKGKLSNFTDTRQKQRSPASNITKDESENPFANFRKILQ